MKSFNRSAVRACGSSLLGALVVMLVMGVPNPLSAQSAPPVQGTVALEGTMKKFYRAANVVIVTTIDGVEHAYRFAKDLVVHGGKRPGVDALEGLREGATVVIHYAADGAEPAAREIDVVGGEGLSVTEGMVMRIDRGRQEITVRYDNGKTETFRLTDRAVAEAPTVVDHAGSNATKVVIYYSDEHGQRIVHFFKKVS